MAIRLSTAKECRNAYREILLGYTYADDGGFYIKHFKEADLGFIESVYKKCANEAEAKGLYLKKEKLAFLKEEGYWTEEEEEGWLVESLAVRDAHEHLTKLREKEQRDSFKEVIKEREISLKKIQKERNELLEPTVEGYCEKILNELYVYHALYKDEKLKEPFFTEEEFEDLSFVELADLVRKYNHATSKFSEVNVKVMAVNHFFLNAFFMCDDDPVRFYGKNVLELTMYQMNLFSRGKFYKSVLVEGREPPDQYYEEDYEDGLYELSKWYDTANNSIRNEREQKIARARASSMRSASAPRRRRR